MLASDLHNPEFMNPQNPDSMLSVEFHWHEAEDVLASEREGKIVKLPKQPYVRIQRPGDMTSIVEVAVREDHKRRWPEKWLYWQMKEGLVDTGREVPGWKIDEWTHLNPEQIRELKFKRFYVVEQIAGASDSQIQGIGMGGIGLREMARQALRERMGSETKQALEEKDAKIAQMEERMARLEAALAKPPEVTTSTVTVDEREFLAEQYKAKHGKNPHPKMHIDKLRAKVNG